MTVSCPPSYPIYNESTKLCYNCSEYTYLNSTDNTCQPCLNTACYTCDPTDPTICLSCANNFQLVNNSCLCDTSSNEYIKVNGQCYSCSTL